MRIFRLIKILFIAFRFGLDEFVLSHGPLNFLQGPIKSLTSWRKLNRPRGERLRLALEALGPIFIKFGQMLSTRRDLIPLDIANELAKLQDQVPPFSSEQALSTLAKVYGKDISAIFSKFNDVPVASASIAQVHLAELHDGKKVAVKILRPNIAPIIAHDVSLMETGAWLAETLWDDGKRLKLREVVTEFARHLDDELDLMREASNCSLLRRNFIDSHLLFVPEVYWDYCHNNVMVMERINGTPISHTDKLIEKNIDIPKLARVGVEIFFTQVFRDGYFHADMHPGNIFVGDDGRYIAVDFGIMGTLSDEDKNYLAQNFLGFFQRDYRRVAQSHVDAGWAPSNTRIGDFETAIRAVCEPIFDKPLKEISFGRVLLQLFQASRAFNVEIQPQLVLLQKTLLNIEGLGRDLDPDLDLWTTAKPYLEKWMSEQVGFRGFSSRLQNEAPNWALILPQFPRLLHQSLAENHSHHVLEEKIAKLLVQEKRQNKRLIVIALILFAFLIWQNM